MSSGGATRGDGHGFLGFLGEGWLQGPSRLLIPFGRWLWGDEIEGAARIPREGPLLIACNHASHLDPWFLGMRSPRRYLRYLITASWYERSRLWRAFFDANGVISTGSSPIVTIGRVLDTLERGEAVVVFPEGGIARDGRIGRGRPGLAWMAALSGAPVLPVGLRGNHRALPWGRRLPRRARVTVHVGELLRFPGAPLPVPDAEAVEAFTALVMERLCVLADQEERLPESRPLPLAGSLLFARSGGQVVGRRG